MFPIGILNSIFGYCKITSDAKNAESFLNLFMKNKIVNWKFQKKSGRTTFFILERDLTHLTRICAAAGIVFNIEGRYGLFPYLRKYKKRIGIPIGIVLFFGILWVSGLFIWEVNVSGNERIKEESIIARLEELGCGIGSFIPSLNLKEIYNKLLVESDEISWISINLRGTVANVEIREILRPETKKPEGDGANLIAEMDGQIELFEIYAGEPAVKIGDTVRAGDLLVSGVIEGRNMGARYVYARGRVYARVTKEIVIEVPLESERKIYTGKEITDTTVKIFGKTINISSNSGNPPDFYDRIDKKEQLSFFGVVSVPIYISTTVYREYENRPYTLSETEAVREAYNRLKTETTAALGDGELLKKTVTANFTEDAYIITCTLYCIQNIAVTSEFEIAK
ncbi:MAG: sporulation protein YqfD [Clostridiales bacterium]|nr:sporulation protein YqfD [Clostridiales bacterium]